MNTRLYVRTKPVRALVVGGLAAIRHGLSMSLDAEMDFDVIGEASSCRQAVSLMRRCAPNLVLLDMDFAELNSFDLLVRIHALAPRTLVILISMNETWLTEARQHHHEVLAVSKSQPVEKMLAEIRAAVSGSRRVYFLAHTPRPPFEPMGDQALWEDHF